MRISSIVVSCALMASTAHAGNVFTVDAGGGGDFTDLQTAVFSVPVFSTLVVQSSLNPAQTIVVDRSLSIIGDSAAMFTITGGCCDLDIQPGGVFDIQAGTTGVVQFSNLRIIGRDLTLVAYGAPGIQVTDAARVLVDRCTVEGGDHQIDECEGAFAGGHGILLQGGTVGALVVSNSVITGGEGAVTGTNPCCDDIPGTPGGDGIRSDAANVPMIYVTDSTVTGGAGGDAQWCDTVCGPFAPDPAWGAGDGGAGVRGSVFLSGSTIGGGAGGVRVWDQINHGVGTDGAIGQSVTGTTTPVSDHLTMNPQQVGVTGSLFIDGLTPNGRFVLFTAFGYVTAPGVFSKGVWFLQGAPLYVFGPFPLDGSGAATVPVSPGIDPCVAGGYFIAQAFDGATLTEAEAGVILN